MVISSRQFEQRYIAMLPATPRETRDWLTVDTALRAAKGALQLSRTFDKAHYDLNHVDGAESLPRYSHKDFAPQFQDICDVCPCPCSISPRVATDNFLFHAQLYAFYLWGTSLLSITIADYGESMC